MTEPVILKHIVHIEVIDSQIIKSIGYISIYFSDVCGSMMTEVLVLDQY